MRALLLVAGALALTACGGAETADNTMNADENLLVTDNLGGENVTIDANNVIIETNGTDNATANAIATDLTTNEADTNTANGM